MLLYCIWKSWLWKEYVLEFPKALTIMIKPALISETWFIEKIQLSAKSK